MTRPILVEAGYRYWIHPSGTSSRVVVWLLAVGDELEAVAAGTAGDPTSALREIERAIAERIATHA